MKSRLALAAMSAIVLLSMAPADAGGALWRLVCTASGTMENQGSWEGDNPWVNLQAEGDCTGYPNGPLSVTLTGSAAADYLFVCPMFVDPTLELRDAAGTTRTMRQSWVGVLRHCFPGGMGPGRGVVLNAAHLPVGTAQWFVGPPDDYFIVQPVSMKWNFLVRPWN